MNEDMSAMLRDIFRVGEVVSTNPENCTVRVQFKDTDDLVSGNLQILKNKTMEDKDYSMYDIGELVACIFLGNGSISGFVLGAIYSEKDKPKENSQEVWAKEFKDGTKIRYDREEHKLDIKLNGIALLHFAKNGDVDSKVNIIIEGDADIFSKENINLIVEKDKKTDVKGSINVSSGIDINVGATGDVNVDASTANFNCPAVNLGENATQGVIHAASPCPLYGVFHLNPSQTTKTAL
jgi:phage baseplate assembly protein V